MSKYLLLHFLNVQLFLEIKCDVSLVACSFDFHNNYVCVLAIRGTKKFTCTERFNAHFISGVKFGYKGCSATEVTPNTGSIKGR